MNRLLLSFICCIASFTLLAQRPVGLNNQVRKIALTFDHGDTSSYKGFPFEVWNNSILSTLDKYQLKAILYAHGKNKLNEKVSFINDLYIDNNYISKNIKDKLIGLAIYKSHKKKCNRIVILNNEDEDTFLNKGFTKNDTRFYSLELE